jgi:hypothetical protein
MTSIKSTVAKTSAVAALIRITSFPGPIGSGSVRVGRTVTAHTMRLFVCITFCQECGQIVSRHGRLPTLARRWGADSQPIRSASSTMIPAGPRT